MPSNMAGQRRRVRTHRQTGRSWKCAVGGHGYCSGQRLKPRAACTCFCHLEAGGKPSLPLDLAASDQVARSS